MTPPHASLEFTHRATKRFRFVVTRNAVVEDISGWSNFSFMVKRRFTDADEDSIYHKVLFDGVEVIDAPAGVGEVTLGVTDGDLLEEGERHNLVGDITGTDGDFETHQLLTLAITTYPRVKRANF